MTYTYRMNIDREKLENLAKAIKEMLKLYT